MELKLQQRLTQQVILTPQMMQGIPILSLSREALLTRLQGAAKPQKAPDVFLEREGGSLRVVYNEENLQAPHNKALQHALEFRKRVILQVAQGIVKIQREFFHKGAVGLRPMLLRDVGDEVGLHESFVSRATRNKLAQTPKGLLPLRLFFQGMLYCVPEGETTPLAVKEKIQALLAQEDPMRPLSDQEIVEALRQQNIEIARRTVTKYRRQLGFPRAAAR